MALQTSVFNPSTSTSISSLNGSELTTQHSINKEMEAETETPVRPELVKCPELLLTGLELEKRTTLRILHKKGRRFESPWEPYFVGIYAHSLFYFANLGEWPRGIVPLVDADIKAVDRIFRQGDVLSEGDACGPCWKITSSVGRVLLFRAPSQDARTEWIDQLRYASGYSGSLRRRSMDGKAALLLARRLSRSSSSASPSIIVQSPHQHTALPCGLRRRRTLDTEPEQTKSLQDALRMVEKQRHEIEKLQARLEEFEKTGAEAKEGMKESEGSRGEGCGLEARGKRDDDVERVYEGEEDEEDQARKSGTEKEDLDLFAILDNASIEICKSSRASVISDVLSEDGDTPVSDENDDAKEEDSTEGMHNDSQESGRDDSQSLCIEKDSTEVQSSCKDRRVAEEADSDGEKENSIQNELPLPCKKVATSASEQETASSLEASKSVSADFRTCSPSVASTSCHDSTENESIQLQAAELVEMARSLHTDDVTDSSSAHESSEDGSPSSSFQDSQTSAGCVDSSAGFRKDSLQQQAMEIAEIARNLQSSLWVDPKPSKAPLESASSSSSILGQSFFSDFGLDQINSNDSNDSIFSITQDDSFFDDDEDGEIERLSEFDASDSHFLEASGFLDSIHQVMKDFIVSTQPDQTRLPEQLVISDEIIAKIREGIAANPLEQVDVFDEADRQLALRKEWSPGETSPKTRSIFPRSARGYFNGENDRAPLPQPPKDLLSLVVEDTMSIVASILQSAGRDDKMLLLSPFLRVFGSRNRLSHLIRWAIEIEVASVINVATLFRSDDYASRLVSTYSKAIGSKFIRVALSDPIRQILKLKIADMELNPHKVESLHDEAQTDHIAANLTRACQNIIDSIMKNTHCIPSSYFHICSHLNSKVISRFDGSKEGVEAEDASTLTRSVIGGFLFLRFVCPAITTPHLYGLTKQLPSPETRRVLVLVTKLLFKTATGVKFGDREPQFKVLNPFIEKNSPAIQQLFANLAMSPSQDIDECFASDSRKIYSHVSSSQLFEDLETIRSVSEKNLDKIEKKLEECVVAADVVENFKTAVLTSSDPLQKSSLTKKLSANMKFLSGFGKKPRSRKPSDQS